MHCESVRDQYIFKVLFQVLSRLQIYDNILILWIFWPRTCCGMWGWNNVYAALSTSCEKQRDVKAAESMNRSDTGSEAETDRCAADFAWQTFLKNSQKYIYSNFWIKTSRMHYYLGVLAHTSLNAVPLQRFFRYTIFLWRSRTSLKRRATDWTFVHRAQLWHAPLTGMSIHSDTKIGPVYSVGHNHAAAHCPTELPFHGQWWRAGAAPATQYTTTSRTLPPHFSLTGAQHKWPIWRQWTEETTAEDDRLNNMHIAHTSIC